MRLPNDSTSLAGVSISSFACTAGWMQYHPWRERTGCKRLATVCTRSRIGEAPVGETRVG
jgi:hypothetical protein